VAGLAAVLRVLVWPAALALVDWQRERPGARGAAKAWARRRTARTRLRRRRRWPLEAGPSRPAGAREATPPGICLARWPYQT
jgi:hypothetical protein